MSLPDHLLDEPDMVPLRPLLACDDGHGWVQYEDTKAGCPACQQRVRADTNATYLEQACDLLEQWRLKAC